jgi:hypothetical protein
VQVHRARDAFHARGAEVFVIGNGAPHLARAFREDLGLEVPLYTDPTLATYRALRFRRGVGATLLSARTWAHALRATRGGFLQGRTQGDAWQLGGVVVVRPDGTIAYRHASAEAGDHPPLDALLAAAGPAPAATSIGLSGPASSP